MIHPNNDLTREEFDAKIESNCGWYLDLVNSYPGVLDSIGSGGIAEAIKYERLYQLAKWGDEIHTWDRFQNILGEEYGESCKASLELDDDYTKYRQELIEVAAVAIRTIQAIDRVLAEQEGVGLTIYADMPPAKEAT